MRRVDQYPARRARAIEKLRSSHREAAKYEDALLRHFFPQPTTWDVDEDPFCALLDEMTATEIEDVIEDLGLRPEIQNVFQCQHCGRYADTKDVVLTWETDEDRHTGDPYQVVVVPSATCSMSMPPRPAKWKSHSRTREGHWKPPVQRATASPSFLAMAFPQKGHF